MRGYTVCTNCMNLIKGVFFLMCVVAAGSGTVLHAQTTTSSTTASETQATSTAQPLPQDAQQRITALGNSISAKTGVLISRLDNIAARLSTRVNLMAQEGYDVVDAEFYLNEATSTLKVANDNYTNTNNFFASFVTSSSYLEQWADIKVSYSQITEHLQKAKNMLSEAVTDLKLSIEESANASSTNTQ